MQDSLQPGVSRGPGHPVCSHPGDRVREGLRGQVLRHLRGEAQSPPAGQQPGFIYISLDRV